MVSVPTWAFLLLCALAAWAALERLLLPSVRWVLRRRVNRVIDELNEHLALRIEPFRLTKRQVLIDRLMFDPDVQAATEAHATESRMRRDEAMDEVRRYAREIVPSFNAYAYFRFGYWIARTLARALYRVRVGTARDARLRELAEDTSVVFVMNHRSNMDYVLVCYLAATRSALSFAVGEWAKVWPLHALLRSTGAYFIRRGSRNDLYRRVLASYVRMATRGGVTQAVYPEGGLSQDGKLQPPRLGLLSYMVGAFADDERSDKPDIVFVPVGINYDRVLEDRTLLEMRNRGRRSPPRVAGLLGGLRFIGKQLLLAITGRWYRFGYAAVGFGEPVSLKEYTQLEAINWQDSERRRDHIQTLGDHLLSTVGDVVPVLPVALVATVVQQVSAPMDRLELKARVATLVKKLEAKGVYVHVPRNDRDYAIDVGLRMLKLRNILKVDNGLVAVNEDELALLDYYAQSIAHHIR